MTELTEENQSTYTKCMLSFISNIKLNNYSLCTRLWGLGKNCAFNSERGKALYFLSKFNPHQLSESVRDAFGIHINKIVKTGIISICQHFYPCHILTDAIETSDQELGTGTGTIIHHYEDHPSVRHKKKNVKTS